MGISARSRFSINSVFGVVAIPTPSTMGWYYFLGLPFRPVFTVFSLPQLFFYVSGYYYFPLVGKPNSVAFGLQTVDNEDLVLL